MIMILFLGTNKLSINNISGTEYCVINRNLDEIMTLPVSKVKDTYSVFEINGNNEYSELYVVNGTNVKFSVSNLNIHFLEPGDFSIAAENSEIVMWLSHQWTFQINGEEKKLQENEYNHFEIESIKISAKCVRSGTLGLFIRDFPDRFFKEFDRLKGS